MSLIQSNTSDRYQAARPVTKRDVKGIPARWRFVLELHLAGHQVTRDTVTQKVDEEGILTNVVQKHSIQELTGYAPSTIYKILSSAEVEEMKQQVMKYYDSEFETLYPEVVDAVRRGLKSGDKYLDAAKLYLKAFGKGGKSKDGSGTTLNLTAEDVVFNILNQPAGSK